MRNTSPQHQRGLSFIGLVLFGALAVSVFAIGGQSLPILLEYQAITKAAKKAAREGGTVTDIRKAFDRSAQIDDIVSVTGSDLEISKAGDKVVIGFEYERDIPLVGPAYLVYRFKDQIK